MLVPHRASIALHRASSYWISHWSLQHPHRPGLWPLTGIPVQRLHRYWILQLSNPLPIQADATPSYWIRGTGALWGNEMTGSPAISPASGEARNGDSALERSPPYLSMAQSYLPVLGTGENGFRYRPIARPWAISLVPKQLDWYEMKTAAAQTRQRAWLGLVQWLSSVHGAVSVSSLTSISRQERSPAKLSIATCRDSARMRLTLSGLHAAWRRSPTCSCISRRIAIGAQVQSTTVAVQKVPLNH